MKKKRSALGTLIVITLGVCLACTVLLRGVRTQDQPTSPTPDRQQAEVEAVLTIAPPTSTPVPTATLGPPTATVDNQAIQAEADAIIQELQSLLEAGRQMEALRSSDDQAKMEQCGNEMRQNQQAAQQLRDRAELLPLNYVMLASAAFHMDRCVSCLPDALEYCDLVVTDLEELQQFLGD